MLESLLELDVYLLQIFNNWGNEKIDPFWLFVTKIWVWVPFLIVLFLLGLKKTPSKNRIPIVLGLLIMLVIVLGLTELIKQLVERLRPCNNVLLEGLFREPIHLTDYSFFSGHTATSVSIAFYFIAFFRKIFQPVYIVIIWAFLFSFSRLYLAAHFPSDILTGAVVGFFIAKLIVKLVTRRFN
ncbi:phosphatase PAP2 family protein [Pseudofulvibacter geojedonensis]|uniref:Phosphatase PAP2 family protein n=1 Tax=Pseudofulvibacter geojedonensis TaxID=1123758 RepID=A0ABW3I0N4_9FLAO